MIHLFAPSNLLAARTSLPTNRRTVFSVAGRPVGSPARLSTLDAYSYRSCLGSASYYFSAVTNQYIASRLGSADPDVGSRSSFVVLTPPEGPT